MSRHPEADDRQEPAGGMRAMLAEQIDLALHLRSLRIAFDSKICLGCLVCHEVCPVGCWAPCAGQRMVEFVGQDRCVACGACVLQCPERAIELTSHGRGRP